VRLAIISDTHLPRGGRRLPDACAEHLRAADLILHGGDLVALSVLHDLEVLGPPVAAIHGNVDAPDVRSALPERRVLEADGARIGMIHDAGPSKGRIARLRRAFPDCHAVVFGHSHIPLHEVDAGGFQIFNPGSPTDRRRQPEHTMGLAESDAGGVRFRFVSLPAP